MPKLPPSDPDDVIRVAKRLGFSFDRQKGSHAVYIRAADGLRIVIPMHRKELKKQTVVTEEQTVVTEKQTVVTEEQKRRANPRRSCAGASPGN